MADTSLRQILILQKLPRSPLKVTVGNIANYLEDMGISVSKRTIQRDLQTLSLRFPLEMIKGEGIGNQGSGWAFSRTAHSALPKMNPMAALTLLLGKEYLDDILPKSMLQHLESYLLEAEYVLNNHDKKGFKDWQQRVKIMPRGHILQQAELDIDDITPIYQALLENNQFVADYKDNPLQVINPLALIHRGPIIYLICTFSKYTDIRITALHRYSNVKLSSNRARRPVTFKIDDYINSGEVSIRLNKDHAKIRVKAHFSSKTAAHLVETPISIDQKFITIEHDKVLVTFSVQDTMEFRWWLLGFGDSVTVMEPEYLHSWFKGVASRMMMNYQ